MRLRRLDHGPRELEKPVSARGSLRRECLSPMQTLHSNQLHRTAGTTVAYARGFRSL